MESIVRICNIIEKQEEKKYIYNLLEIQTCKIPKDD